MLTFQAGLLEDERYLSVLRGDVPSGPNGCLLFVSLHGLEAEFWFDMQEVSRN